jgi:3-isopropylmalate dehydrogenase
LNNTNKIQSGIKMNTKKIAVLPGDGIGPEVVKQALRVLEKSAARHGFALELKEGLIGAVAIDATGNPLPDETISICKQADAVLLGAVGHPRFDNDPNAKVRPEQGLLKIRKTLGLFANIRPIATYPVLNPISPLKDALLKDVDFIVYRELTGGIYFGEKGRSEDGQKAYDNCVYSREEISRIAKLAFEAARSRKKHLTLVDKANVLETSRLWRDVVRGMVSDYADVEVDYLFVDAASMKIIQNPAWFDVILTENMFGDILTDEASVITGSIGLLPSASVGDGSALFEPIHGSWPQAAGKNLANPLGTILSVAMMMDYFKLPAAAAEIRAAVEKTLESRMATSDINPEKNTGTTEVGDFVLKCL